MRTYEALAAGIALFNEGRFWDAHEAWEEAWLEEEDERKLCLQGLIQIAAGYHKAFVQRQPSGCVKLLRSGLEKLEPLPRDFLGVELGPLIAAARASYAEAADWLGGTRAGISAAPRIAMMGA